MSQKIKVYEVFYNLNNDSDEKQQAWDEANEQYGSVSNVMWPIATFASKEDAQKYLDEMTKVWNEIKDSRLNVDDFVDIYNPYACSVEEKTISIDEFAEHVNEFEDIRKQIKEKKEA